MATAVVNVSSQDHADVGVADIFTSSSSLPAAAAADILPTGAAVFSHSSSASLGYEIISIHNQ